MYDSVQKFVKWWKKVFTSYKDPSPMYFEGCGWFDPPIGYVKKESNLSSRPPAPRPLPSAYRSPTFLRMCGYTPRAIDKIINDRNNPPSP